MTKLPIGTHISTTSVTIEKMPTYEGNVLVRKEKDVCGMVCCLVSHLWNPLLHIIYVMLSQYIIIIYLNSQQAIVFFIFS